MIRLIQRSARSTLILSMTLGILTQTGCGPSKADMEAQLAKYSKLASENQADKDELAAKDQELEDYKKRVKILKDELKRMGLNLDTIGADLQKAGTERERLSKNLTNLKLALEEYKARADQLEKIKARFDALQNKLKKLTELGLKVEIRHNRMVIRLPGDVLFASGSIKLREKGREVVLAVADVIRKDDQLSTRYFQVAGHTDSQPVRGGKWGDNWGLSAIRAREVLLILTAKAGEKGGGLKAGLLHVAGYGAIDPVANNDEKDGREQNRRVELVLLPNVEEMLDLKNL